jgi:dolichol-phosphate mannosyltransferase
MERILIIIPTYDEKENVRSIAEAILATVPEVHILFVDDNSPDGTGVIIDEMVAANPRIHVLHRPGKMGLGRAYIDGFKWGLGQGFDFLFEMDADFSHDPKAIRSFLEAAKNADLVLGTRYKGGIRVLNWPLNRLMISVCAGVFVRVVTGLPVSDPTGGFKCFRKEVLQAIDLEKIKSNGYSFQMEMTHTAWRLGFRIAEVPSVFEDRRYGHSKLNKAIARESFWMVWRLAWRNKFRRHVVMQKK